MVMSLNITRYFFASLLVLAITLAGCSHQIDTEEETHQKDLPEGYTLEKYHVEEITEVPCKLDSDCKTPFDYLIQSRCPFTSKCLNNQCAVICPYYEGDIKIDPETTKINESNLKQIELPENIITEEECINQGGEVFNTLGVEN